MKMRDIFKDQAYFEHYVEYRERQRIPKYISVADAVDTDAAQRLRLRYSIFRESCQLLIAKYSRGDAISVLQHTYPQVINALQQYQAEKGANPFDFQVLEQYVHALWLVSLGILLDVDTKSITALAGLINQDEVDRLFDRLVALRIPGRAIASVLIHPKPYSSLCDALDVSGEQRSILICKFLKQYYQGMSSTYWHNTHLKDQAGFFGYWCFELAAFVESLKMDDQEFAASVFYPRDLAGHELIRGLADLAHAVTKDGKNVILCPYCMGVIRQETEVCSHCNKDVTRDAPIEMTPEAYLSGVRSACSFCGQPVMKLSKICPFCGKKV